MKASERRIIATILIAARASVDAALLALGESIDDEEEEEEEEGCAHPQESREDLTTMGGLLEWRCRICGFHSRENPTPQPIEG